MRTNLTRGKMVQNAGGKRNNNTISAYEKEGTAYEEERRETIMRNKEVMQSLNIRELVNETFSAQPAKKKKKASHCIVGEGLESTVQRPNLRPRTRVRVVENEEGPNLRPRTRVTSIENEEEQENPNSEYEPIEEPLEENAGDGQPKERKVRGYTKKADIYARQKGPKLKVQLNEMGQPVGGTSSPLANFIGTLVRTKGFPLAHTDWRLVCSKKKYQLWTDTAILEHIDRGLFNWVYATAAKKWKEFKADLKLRLFDETKDDDELLELRDERVLEADWKWLIDYWRTPEAIARSIIGKENRAKLTTPHTAGSKSFARVRHEKEKEDGCTPRRDELFVITHTHKSGVPHLNAVSKIKALQDAAIDHPELKERTIQEGDLYGHVFGKEKRGYVRMIGLGPTPGDLGLPGARKYTPTKLQMEIEARRRADQQVEILTNRMDEMDEIRQAMQQQLDDLKKLVALHAVPNTNSTPQDGSNSMFNMNVGSEEHHVDEQENDGNSEAESYARNEVRQSDEANLVIRRRVIPPMAENVEGGRGDTF